ncbi:3-oxo-5-alpha-steroid 4-dehydrogenase-domain-containing protein [Syncephalis plumigaleata]|nr:3-oxo-5-alpha-steroid 4-dehydrogenase-domain-containing protein [Syncephalis plumigaleata]
MMSLATTKFTNQEDIYQCLLAVFLIAAPVIFIGSQLMPALYGRIVPSKYRSCTVSGRIAWFLGEIVSPISLLCGVAGYNFLHLDLQPIQHDATYGSTIKRDVNDHPRISYLSYMLICLWLFHYINRSIIYPLRAVHMSPIPLPTIAFMVCFNYINGWTNGYSLRKSDMTSSHMTLHSSSVTDWLRCLIGLSLFCTGFALNVYSDNQLLAMKRRSLSSSNKQRENDDADDDDDVKQKEPLNSSHYTSKYSIPHGGMFELISCPHYLGEMIEWTGWALVANSLPAYLFVLNTLANLIPRALKVHAWYRETFPNYPPQRRAIIPFIL